MTYSETSISSDDYMVLVDCFAFETTCNCLFASEKTPSPDYLSSESADELLQSEILSPGLFFEGIATESEFQSKTRVVDTGLFLAENQFNYLDADSEGKDHFLQDQIHDQPDQTCLEYGIKQTTTSEDVEEFSATDSNTAIHSMVCLISTGEEIDGLDKQEGSVSSINFHAGFFEDGNIDSKRTTNSLKRKRGEIPFSPIFLESTRV